MTRTDIPAEGHVSAPSYFIANSHRPNELYTRFMPKKNSEADGGGVYRVRVQTQ